MISNDEPGAPNSFVVETSSSHAPTTVILRVAGIALGYAFAAKCSLFLAVPPGFASPIWPASAVALVGILLYGYRYLPAVFLGSLLINLHISLSGGMALAWGTPLAIPPLIALGASVQAAASVWLLKRNITLPNKLENTGDITLLALLGGPIGCIINSIWAPLVLHALGALPTPILIPTIVTWWIGDALGVVCFAPLLLLIFGPEFRQQRIRKVVVSGVQLGVFALVVFAVGILKETDQKRRKDAFDHAVASVSAHLQESILGHKNALMALSAFFDASDRVEVEEFTQFTSDFFQHYPGLYGLSWAPKVSHATRAEFENSIHAAGRSDFFIKDAISPTQLVQAGDRSVYFPVTYVAPLQRNRGALGLDVYAIPERRAAMLRSELTDSPQSTGPISIIQVTKQLGMLAYRPVFTHPKADSKQKELVGYLAGVFIFDKMLKSSANLAASSALDLVVRERSKARPTTTIFDTRNPHSLPYSSKFSQFAHFSINVFGSNWDVAISENAIAIARNDGRSIWFSLIGGCLLSSLTGLFLLTVTGRTEAVQRLVQEKTEEVRANATKLEAFNQDLFRLAKEADAANIAKSQFLASMSHEIRTPMNGLLGVIHLIEDGLPDDKQDLIKAAKQSADSLLVLINDILDFSKIEAGKMGLDESEFDVMELVEEVALLHTASCQEKDVTLRLQISPQAGRLARGDHHRLKQVLSNLLGNAVKFTSHGSISLSCEYEETSYGSRFVFGVRDTGIGIKTEAHPQLFESFTQADAGTTRKYGGSGLGLSICKRLVELMGGTIHVSSEEGVGSYFCFYIPQNKSCPPSPSYQTTFLNNERAILALEDDFTLTQVSTWLEWWGASITSTSLTTSSTLDEFSHASLVVTDSPTFAQHARQVCSKQPQTLLITHKLGELRSGSMVSNIAMLSLPLRTSRLKETLLKKLAQPSALKGPYADLSEYSVLLVDDNRTNLLVARALLQRSLNIEPDVANGGNEALEMLGARHYDLVLMDCMMPDMDGYQATTALRRGDAGDENRQVPVIALTANAMASDRALCIAAGMSDYLTKPLSPRILEETLLRWVGQPHPAT